ncbi:hypothetical protein PQ455_20830 (plasmid) [Sphingomonas naphthae]|uniref:Uncharacterized protein n=1 Tax=Sphingomonas naphthae TaxID=1813468 RepID=A0ABY7TSE8_9SPHN|nr:hypothetical protein [Sphingomonas naphthae]WCT75870.1 hypothetical protein PQ455_20830 [Sphingomonas naphthae]
MEAATMFFTRRDFAGVASTLVHRPAKQFEATIDRLFGEQVRADGAFGVDLWCALAGVEWRNGQAETVCYSHRCAGEVIAWVREDGGYLEWYASGEAGEVADWIGDALRDAGWSWSIPDRPA